MPSRFARSAILLAVALALPVFPRSAMGQGAVGTIRGRIIDASSGRALSEAQVTVEGTRLGAITGVTGEYSIVAVPAGSQTVTVRRLGYRAASATVTVAVGSTATVNSALNVSAVNLSEIVVTGSGAPTERRRVGTSIASIDSTVLTRAQAVTIDQALQGKIPGAQISQNSGGPGGGGISVRLRGTNSFSSPTLAADRTRRTDSPTSIRRTSIELRSSAVPPRPRFTDRAPIMASSRYSRGAVLRGDHASRIRHAPA